MSPTLRRVIYVLSYEAFALLLATGGLMALGHSGSHSGITALVSSVIALSWNFVWTTLFEAWERRQASRRRTVKRRIGHALGFEAGLIFFLVPAMAWTLQVGYVEAFLLDLGLIVFFLIYTFVFAWLFDLVFPPGPQTAPEPQPTSE